MRQKRKRSLGNQSPFIYAGHGHSTEFSWKGNRNSNISEGIGKLIHKFIGYEPEMKDLWLVRKLNLFKRD